MLCESKERCRPHKQRVPIDDSDLAAWGKICPQGQKKVATSIQRHTADYVAQRDAEQSASAALARPNTVPQKGRHNGLSR